MLNVVYVGAADVFPNAHLLLPLKKAPRALCLQGASEEPMWHTQKQLPPSQNSVWLGTL